MLSEPRTISLLCEVVHLPVKHTTEALRAVYNKICGPCGYENFIRLAGGARLERRELEAEGFSHLTFSGHRMQFTEDHTGASVEQFARKVRTASQDAMTILRLPVVLVQQATVRIVATPNQFKTAAEFLARSIFRIRGEDLEVLGRPTSVFGFRLLFPSVPQHPSTFNVRVESYLRDPRSVFVETTGTFKEPIPFQRLETLEKNIDHTAHFVIHHVLPFLSRYDRSDPEC